MNHLLWAVYWPLLKFLSFWVFWLPEFQVRKRFEKKNASDALCRSFRESNITADLCFEFSSEGEYQQVASLIDDALAVGKRVELVFFSPSVEKAIMGLAEKHPGQARYLRYPLAHFSPWGRERCFSRWITSRKLILVRYDFFPEFLLWAYGREKDLIILWTTFKKERSQNKQVSWPKRAFLKRAQKIVYASLSDQQMGAKLGRPGPFYDFRMEQIRRRVGLRDKKFEEGFPQYQALKSLWEKWPRDKRLIFGNAWPSDLFLLEKLPEDLFLLVVPHQLDEEKLMSFRKCLIKIGRSPLQINEDSLVGEGDSFVVNKKGVLCELYADFGLAYVGGGFEASVHSLLEPLVAGADAIASGPRHHRSTEFDVAQEHGLMAEVRNPEDFHAWLLQEKAMVEGGLLGEVFDKYEEHRKEVISC